MFWLTLLLLPPLALASVVVSNVHPRLDSATGEILELGDGSLHKFGGKYYLYGVKYVCTPSPHTPLFYGCPKKDRRIWGNMSIGVASSTDLMNWTLESYNIVPEMHEPGARWPARDYAWFMPTIIRNSTHYALWYYIDDHARGVAVSESPTGPFKIVHDCVPNLMLGSDFFFWTAPNGTTFVKHNGGCTGSGTVVRPGDACPQHVRRGNGVCVARLAPNMTDVLQSSPPIDAPGEGGGIFERDGRWYIMQGHGCCFCWAGDDAQVFESNTGPFGPYAAINTIINCSHKNHRGYPGQGVSSNLTCGGPGPRGPGPSMQTVPGAPQRGPGAQQFGVYPILEADGDTAYVYVGIRFGSAPDGNKCHEYQYWDKLEFDDDGHVLPMRFHAEVSFDI